MAEQDVDEVIALLRQRLGAATDADLARKLRIGQSAISAWRSRGRVPERFVGILLGDDKQFFMTPPAKWAEHEELAFRLALFRYMRLAERLTRGGSHSASLRLHAAHSSLFWAFMHTAQEELASTELFKGGGLQTALLLAIAADLDASEAAIERDVNMLRNAGAGPLLDELLEV